MKSIKRILVIFIKILVIIIIILILYFYFIIYCDIPYYLTIDKKYNEEYIGEDITINKDITLKNIIPEVSEYLKNNINNESISLKKITNYNYQKFAGEKIIYEFIVLGKSNEKFEVCVDKKKQKIIGFQTIDYKDFEDNASISDGYMNWIDSDEFFLILKDYVEENIGKYKFNFFRYSINLEKNTWFAAGNLNSNKYGFSLTFYADTGEIKSYFIFTRVNGKIAEVLRVSDNLK